MLSRRRKNLPHDKNGTVVSVGDIVTVEFVVKDVSPNDEYCNCTLETAIPMFPANYATSLVVNTKQVNKTVPEETSEETPPVHRPTVG